MEKRSREIKKKETKTAASGLYDCCWYEPPCNDLCCGGVCGCS